MTLIKSKINPLAWLKSATYISVLGVIILLPKSASAAFFHSPFRETETRSTYALNSRGSFGDFPLTPYLIHGTYWEGNVNVWEEKQFFKDVLIISGFFQHRRIPSHPQDKPTTSEFRFNFVVDTDNGSNNDNLEDNYLAYRRDNTYAHSEHSDSFNALVRATTEDTAGFDRITSWVFTLEGNHRSEPVPEPTTIFGSAIGLCLGGWLKRKKSSLQNKTTSQS